MALCRLSRKSKMNSQMPLALFSGGRRIDIIESFSPAKPLAPPIIFLLFARQLTMHITPTGPMVAVLTFLIAVFRNINRPFHLDSFSLIYKKILFLFRNRIFRTGHSCKEDARIVRCFCQQRASNSCTTRCGYVFALTI